MVWSRTFKSVEQNRESGNILTQRGLIDFSQRRQGNSVEEIQQSFQQIVLE